MDQDEAIWFKLAPAEGETLRSALGRTLREAIQNRALRSGVRLPASRLLAHDLGVSRGVVSDAYGELEAEGFLVVRPREAPVVAAVRGSRQHRAEPEGYAAAPLFDFTPTTPDVSLFPLAAWLGAARLAARTTAPASLDYRPSCGESRLRAALADHLGRTRGVIADPSQIVIVQGTAQGVDLVLRVLRGRGVARVAVEDPSHTTQQQRIRAQGLDLVSQPVDREGIVVTGLEADSVFVTPAHQFPTGSVCSGQRRRDLIGWSNAGGGLIVEDDYDAEFRYDREPVRALQGLAPDRVIHLGTVSKTLAPALRLGWLVAPEELVDDIVHTKRLLDDFTPSLDQLTLAEFLIRGGYARHVRRARAVYRARRDRLLGALARHLPELDVEGIAAGLHVLLRLPEAVDDCEVSGTAARSGIRVPALSHFRIRPHDRGGLVVGYGRLRDQQVETAVAALAKSVRPLLEK